jgi:hypothetical protein
LKIKWHVSIPFSHNQPSTLDNNNVAGELTPALSGADGNPN